MRWSRLVAGTAIVVGVATVCGWGFMADRLDGVQNRWEDALQPGLAGADDVVVVGIDRATLAALGADLPLPRELHAELLSAIGAGDPAVVVYDVLFAGSQSGDEVLVDALRETPTVLPTALILTVPQEGPPEILEAAAPADDLAAAAADLGHVNITNAASTGVVRGLPLYALDERGIAQPSIALAAVAVKEGATGPLIERHAGVQVGDRFIPLDDAELRINWSEELDQGDVIPAIDVLAGSTDPDLFRDRIVVVGITEPTAGDQHLVPTDRSGGTSGAVVIANATNTILSSGYLERPSTTAQLGLIVLVAALTVTLLAALRLVAALLAALAVVAAVVVGAAWAFHTDGTLWNVVWPTLSVMLAAGAGTVWRYQIEVRHRRRAWRLFSTYVPAEVVRQLEDRDRLNTALSGVRCDVSVVMLDVRGFTELSGSLAPARVRQLLDTYYGYTVAIVHRHRGTVMQFVGDEVFAVFGAPVTDEGAGVEALRCALELQDDVATLDERLTAAGLPAIRFGVGVHRGCVVAAHVGTEDRRQYGVVGEAVNIGGRLCEAAGAGEVVASEESLQPAAAELRRHFVADGPIELKGVQAAISVYRALRAPLAPRTADLVEGATPGEDRRGEPVDVTSGSTPIGSWERATGTEGAQSGERDR